MSQTRTKPVVHKGEEGWKPEAGAEVGVRITEETSAIVEEQIGRALKIGPITGDIVNRIFPEAIEAFVEAAAHYGDRNGASLGLRGQWSDIWRKIGPLRRYMWRGEPLTRESARTILLDLIGHAVLTVEMLDRADREGWAPYRLQNGEEG